jgi:hypothetical protein
VRKKPLYFSFLSLLLIVVAISFPLQIIYEYDIALSDFALALELLTFMNIAVMFMCLWVAYDSFVVSPRLKYSSVVLIAVTILNNAFVGYVAINYSMWETVLASSLFVLPFGYLLTPTMRPLIKDTRLHWWKNSPRYQYNWAVKIDGLDSLATSLNVSKSGILVKVDAEAWAKKITQVDSYSHFPIIIEAGNKTISKQGRLIRQQMPPQGTDIYVAFKFDRELNL